MKKITATVRPAVIMLPFFLLTISVPEGFSQNIGIGTTTPTRAKLEVHGAVGTTSAIFGGESTGISLQRNWPAIGFNEYYNGGSKYMANGFAARQSLDPGNGFMYIDMFPPGTADGGIGSFYRSIVISNTCNIGIRTSPANSSLYAIKAGNSAGSAVFAGSSYISAFHYSGTEDTYIRGGYNNSRVIINDIPDGKIIMGGGSSYVGINNGVPVYPLEIRQVSGRGLILVEPNNSYDNWAYRVQKLNVYIGAGSDLEVFYNGVSKGYFKFEDGGYEVWSDARLKHNIRIVPEVLEKVMRLEVVKYEMANHNPGKASKMGLIAQDVKRLFPDLVVVSPEMSSGYEGITDLHGLNYKGFTVIAIKALQEQQRLLKDLESMNKELRHRIKMAENSAILRE